MTELQAYWLNDLVLHEISIQLQKDLHPHIDWPSELFELKGKVGAVQFLTESLRKLDQEPGMLLAAVLYRIDVGERASRESMRHEDRYDRLAEHILNRELRKVLFRLHFDPEQR